MLPIVRGRVPQLEKDIAALEGRQFGINSTRNKRVDEGSCHFAISFLHLSMGDLNEPIGGRQANCHIVAVKYRPSSGRPHGNGDKTIVNQLLLRMLESSQANPRSLPSIDSYRNDPFIRSKHKCRILQHVERPVLRPLH